MKRKLGVCRCVFTLAALLGGVAGLYAQTTNATISGMVTDSTGAALPGATVQVKNVDTGITRTVVTSGQGRYNVPDLLVGSYQVQASAMGFQTVVRSGITLTVGSQNVVDFSLPVGQAQQTVTVEGQVPQVDTTSAAVSNLVDESQMRDLPLNGRNFEQLISLAPGVQQVAPSGGALYGNQNNYSIAGSRPEGQEFLLDNTNVQDFWNHGTGSGFLGTSLGVEAIQEFQLLTDTYSAQFGGSGAVVNAASKSGTNEVHGSAYEFLRNSALDARNFFDVTKPEFRRNQFGGSLGGPIKKDKLFFFVNYEGLRQSLGETGRAFVPDANVHQGLAPNGSGGFTNVGVSPTIAPILSLYPLPNGPSIAPGIGIYNSIANQVGDENYLLARGDWNLSASDEVYFRYVMDRANQVVPFSGSQIALWPEGDNTRNQYFTTEERKIVTPSIVNLARFSFVRPVETAQTTGETPPLDFFPGLGRQDGSVVIQGGLSAIGANSLIPFNITQNRFYVGDDVIWSHGNHSIRFGMEVARVQSNINAPFILGGQYTFSNLTTFLQAKPVSFLGVAPDQGDAYRDFREIDLTPYIQDDWKVTPTLTLNLGLRYEFVTNPVGVRHPLNTVVNPPLIDPPGSTGFTQVDHVFANNPNARNFDPRFGFAWDPFKDHKTSVRGGFGIFHDQIAPRTYASDYYLAPPFAFGFQVGPTFPNPFPNYVPGRTRTGPVSILEGVDYQIGNAPYMMQYNFNIQRQITANNAITVGYVGSKGVHLFVQSDQNPPIPTVNGAGQQVFGTISPVTGTVIPNPRINPAFSYMNNGDSVGTSDYNSLQVNFNRRFTSNLQSQISYTWSKCIDYGSGSYGLEGAVNSVDPYNRGLDRGRCSFDINHSVTVNSVLALPFKGNRLVEGWEITGILNAHTGAPFIISTGFDQAGLQNATPRPNVIAGCHAIVGKVNEWFNPACFTLEPVGTLGDLARDAYSGPGYFDLDAAVIKDTKITEKVSAQFRAEFFNILNHPDFLAPAGTYAGVFVQTPFTGSGTVNPTAGQITSTTLLNQRQIQFALKLLF